jgi:hypothetical protein
MTDRLGLYNEALRECGQRKLGSLAEDTPARYYLDDVWDGGGIDHCLQQGLWNFAIRTVRFEYEAAIEPEFGYAHAFAKPADFLRLVQIGSTGSFAPPLNAYEDERGFWWANCHQLFVRYVSNDEIYGGDLSLWTPAFNKFVALHFACAGPAPKRVHTMRRKSRRGFRRRAIGAGRGAAGRAAAIEVIDA